MGSTLIGGDPFGKIKYTVSRQRERLAIQTDHLSDISIHRRNH